MYVKDIRKEEFTSFMILKPFDPKLRTQVLVDARHLWGLGYLLVQIEESGQIRIICCGSTGLSDAQKRYATIELEALGASWACKKASFYLIGAEFDLVMNHSPLLGVMKKSLLRLRIQG